MLTTHPQNLDTNCFANTMVVFNCENVVLQVFHGVRYFILDQSIHTVCEGQDAGTVVHGSTVEDILGNAYSDFCGCQYISKNVHLDFSAVGFVDVSFVEANFSYFHDIKEITGYVFLNVPPVDQLSFPKLRIIRGEESIPGASGIALAVSGKIQSLYLPLLTEISAGGVYFTDEGDPTALCNVMDGSDASGYGVHWNDILNDDNGMKVFQITGCTGSGMSSLCTQQSRSLGK